MEVLGNVASLRYFMPEIILTVTSLAVLCAGLVLRGRDGLDGLTGLTLVGLGGAFLAHVSLYDVSPVVLFMGMVAHDYFALFFKGFFILCGVITVLISMSSTELRTFQKAEYNCIILGIVLGMCLVASSVNMLMLYLSVELMSIGSYVLVGLAKEERRSREASIKYILYGGMSTGVMLFGMTLLYGLTGTTAMFGPEGIAAHLAGKTGTANELLLFSAFLLSMVGVGYKIAAVPFHFWCPDVYEGAPTPITAFLSVASKGTGFALLIRFFYQVFLTPGPDGVWKALPGIDWVPVLILIAAATMTLGNLGALPQTNLKRLLAYSGIAHAGYVLMGAAVLSTSGIEAMVFYLIMYLFTNLGAFTIVIILIDRAGIVEVSQYCGLWKRNLPLAVAMAICLLSLIGVPPTAGFIGKYYLFIAVIRAATGSAAYGAWFWALVIVAALNTVVSCYYYFRVVRAMFLEKAAQSDPITPNPFYHGLAWVLTAAVVLLFLFPGQVSDYTVMCSRLMR